MKIFVQFSFGNISFWMEKIYFTSQKLINEKLNI